RLVRFSKGATPGVGYVFGGRHESRRASAWESAGSQIFDCQSAQHRAVLSRHIPRRVRQIVTPLDAQPLAFDAFAARSLEGPAALQFPTVQENTQMTALDPFAGTRFDALPVVEINWIAIVVDDRVRPGVPDNDLAATVLTGGNDAFEGAVLERVVFGLDRQAAFLRVVRWPLGNRPTDQHPIDFQAEIVVESARRVFLDSERQRAAAADSGGRRLGSTREVAHLRVSLEAPGWP